MFKDVIAENIDYSRPVKLAEDVYWVGFGDQESGLQCNPYLIIDNGEGILIDGGSRPDFSTVMMKIMQTGLAPSQISTLIYQHYDPDLCGSISNFESIIERKDLKIISHSTNNVFIRHYGVKSKLLCIDTLGKKLSLSSGRILEFHRTPYAHSAGSFVTHDQKTSIVFTSDVFSSYGTHTKKNNIFFVLPDDCVQCKNKKRFLDSYECDANRINCYSSGFLRFHRQIMTSNKALRNAVQVIKNINASVIAPQHGHIIHQKKDIEFCCDILMSINDVGIDGYQVDTSA